MELSGVLTDLSPCVLSGKKGTAELAGALLSSDLAEVLQGNRERIHEASASHGRHVVGRGAERVYAGEVAED